MMGISTSRHRVQEFLIFLCLAIISSQSVGGERLPVKNYTSADGLGSSFINHLMRDSRGFMWFCTRDGLSRFDGARFVTYRIGDKNAQPGAESVTETRDGTYWITTTSGLYRFRPDAASRPDSTDRSRPTLNAEFIDSRRGRLLEDRIGNLWYGGGPLYHLEEKDGKVSFQQIELNLPAPPTRPSGVIGMSEASDGSLWLYTSAGLARRLPDGRLIFYPSETIATRDNSMCILDADQRVWYAQGSGLYVLKPEPLESLTNLGQITVKPLKFASILTAKTETEIRLPEQEGELLRFTGKDFLVRDPAHRLCQTSNKHIWLTSDSELIEFDGRVFHRFTPVQGLPLKMSTIAEDSGGNLWIGGQTVLVRLDRKGLTSYGEADGFHSPAIHAINEGKDGKLYFADGDFYLSQFDGNHFQTARLNLAPNPRSLWTSRYAFLDSRNEWWILTDEKLYRFAASNLAKPLAAYTTSDGLKANSMFQIFEDARGDIWVSVQSARPANNGLALFERSKNRFHTFTEAEGFPPNKAVSSFAEDRNGNLWLGFYEGGIARYADHRFAQFDAAPGMPKGLITDLKIDRNGRLWLASSGGGIGRIDDPGAEKLNVASLTVDDGLSSNNIRTITEDNFGNIYAGTARGVDRISPETNNIKHYSVNDGLAGDFVVDSRCDKNGMLWFATTNGLSKLAPTADENHLSPPVWLGGLRIAGVPQPLSELGEREIGTIELSHAQNNLQLDFFGLDFHAGETLRYQYRLEGAGVDWSAPTEQRTVTFAYLRPGTYRFEVRAISAQGVASEKPAVVSFKISPPVWLSWWFISLASILVATIALAIIGQRAARRRERERAQRALREVKEERLRELEQVRRRIAADLHDDIGSNLTRISLLSEVAQRRLDGHDGLVREQLSSVAKLSRELIDSMSEIVWAINPQKDHLGDLSQRMRHFASDLLTARQIDFRFVAVDFDRDIKVGANVRREFFLIFKEGVNNIVRHSGCNAVEIEFRAEDDCLALILTDNGKGFDETVSRNGHGLVSMRERIRSLDGSLEINSAPGRGATLKFVIPLHPRSKAGG
jgi:signal transduction histidine kinase/ligand-binding sensor domain-containing protein